MGKEYTFGMTGGFRVLVRPKSLAPGKFSIRKCWSLTSLIQREGVGMLPKSEAFLSRMKLRLCWVFQSAIGYLMTRSFGLGP